MPTWIRTVYSRRRRRWLPPSKAAGGATTYEISPSGTITPTGALVKQANKVLAGSVAPSGALVNQVGKILAGGITPAGALAKLASKRLQGWLLDRAALLVRADSTYLSVADNATISVTGDFTIVSQCWLDSKPSEGGGLMWIIGKFDFANSQREYGIQFSQPLDRFRLRVSPNGTGSTNLSADSFGSPPLGRWITAVAWHDSGAQTVSIQIDDGPVDSVAHVGGIFDGTSEFRIGSIPSPNPEFWNGKLRRVGLFKRVLSGAERTAYHNGGEGLTYAEMVAAGLNSNVAGYWNLDELSDGTAAVTRRDSAGSQHLTDNGTTASTSPGGALVDQVGKVLAGALAPAGVAVKQVGKMLAGGLAPSGALAKAATKVLGGSIAPSGGLVRQANKALGGTITPAGTLSKLVSRSFGGSLAPIGGLANTVRKFLAGLLAPVGDLIAILAPHLAPAETFTAPTRSLTFTAPTRALTFTAEARSLTFTAEAA